MLHDLLCPQAIVVILERYARTFRIHLLELAASLPCVRPCPVVQRIANRVVGDRLAVVTGQLVLPVAVAVDVEDRLNCRSDCARSVSVLHFAQNVPAAVVVVHPRRILMRIIYTNQLPQCIVLIRRGQVSALLGDDVSSAIIFISEERMLP